MDMNIISGNKGFVGLNLSLYLRNKGKNVIGVSRKPIKEEIRYKDISKEVLHKSKSFIHLAGKAHDLKKTSNESEYFEVNTELTKKNVYSISQ